MDQELALYQLFLVGHERSLRWFSLNDRIGVRLSDRGALLSAFICGFLVTFQAFVSHGEDGVATIGRRIVRRDVVDSGMEPIETRTNKISSSKVKRHRLHTLVQ